MSNFCAKNLVEGENGKEDFPNGDILDFKLRAWKTYFDGAVNQYGNGIGVLFITPDGSHVPLAIKLNFKVTNNMAKYKACIAGMEALRRLGVREAKVFRDLTLVITQAQKLWKSSESVYRFFATLASMVEITKGVWTQLLKIKQSYQLVHKEEEELSILAIDERGAPWYYDIIFPKLGIYPDKANKKEHCLVRMMVIQYILCGGQFYRRSYNGIHLHWLKKEEAEKVVEEIH
ncbi:uncharacterized protein LOC111984693 [Quercus suber]|uniref:uncharacterized protein LOC111984693 n=1 Tax=Quercus suber TaxID=58331 RepID=UPI000CE289F7|nr:uncharacterized protein LOC111984693 [Quercus suber]